MITPRHIAQCISEDAADTYIVLKENGLWHRQQRTGEKFPDDTPLEVVLDFISKQDQITRYDLQSFLDYLQGCISSQSAELRDQIGDERLDDVCDLLITIVPTLRRSQAQANSADHAKMLLQRHIDRLIVAIQQAQDLVPEQTLDLVHNVAGGIMQACEIIGDELIPRLWYG